MVVLMVVFFPRNSLLLDVDGCFVRLLSSLQVVGLHRHSNNAALRRCESSHGHQQPPAPMGRVDFI